MNRSENALFSTKCNVHIQQHTGWNEYWNVNEHPQPHHPHFNTKLSMTLRNPWKQTEDVHGMDFALDLAQVSIFSCNPWDKALIPWSLCFRMLPVTRQAVSVLPSSSLCGKNWVDLCKCILLMYYLLYRELSFSRAPDWKARTGHCCSASGDIVYACVCVSMHECTQRCWPLPFPS